MGEEQRRKGQRQKGASAERLWRLVHVLDRSIMQGFLYCHSTQLLACAPDDRCGHALGTAWMQWGDADPAAYHGSSRSGAPGDGGLLGLRHGFPGTMEAVDACVVIQSEGALVASARPMSACRSFRQAAAVHLTVRLLCAAVRSFFSCGRTFSLQVDSAPTPHELVRAVLADARKLCDAGRPHDPRGERRSPAQGQATGAAHIPKAQVCLNMHGPPSSTGVCNMHVSVHVPLELLGLLIMMSPAYSQTRILKLSIL